MMETMKEIIQAAIKALEEQMEYVKISYRGRAEEFENIMNSVKNSTTAKAIEIICEG